MPLLLCFSEFGAITVEEERELGCREMMKKKKERKIRVKRKCVFSCMCFFNGVCREIKGV